MTAPKAASALPYVLPFALFALLTCGGPLLSIPLAVVYPAKTLLVAASLIWFWPFYRTEIRPQIDWPALAAGVLVFFAWIGLEGLYPQIGAPASLPAADWQIYGSPLFVAVRLAGAVLVVPIMEELFWRSFAMRTLVDFDFRKVRLGRFTWFSFLVVAIAFGFEHERWLPGIVAGAAYAGLLYRTQNLFSPVLAHSVTNLLLGIYVLNTGRWAFW